MIMAKETYKLKVKCTNCLHEWRDERDMGKHAIEPFECPYCGCLEGIAKGRPYEDVDTIYIPDIEK